MYINESFHIPISLPTYDLLSIVDTQYLRRTVCFKWCLSGAITWSYIRALTALYAPALCVCTSYNSHIQSGRCKNTCTWENFPYYASYVRRTLLASSHRLDENADLIWYCTFKNCAECIFLKDENRCLPLLRSFKIDPFMLHVQYRSYWWPGEARSQGSSSHRIDFVSPKYSGLSTRRINNCGWN